MLNRLMKLDEIMELLGYTDSRSVESWCKERKIPLFGLGKEVYTISNFMEVFLESEVRKFVYANYDEPEKIIDSILNDDKIELAERVSAPLETNSKKQYKSKVKFSKESEDFINNLKAS
jgi:hypothetical protein